MKTKFLFRLLLLIDLLFCIWMFSVQSKINAPQIESRTETIVEQTTIREPYNIFTEEGKEIVREYSKPFTYREDIPLDRDTQEYIYYLGNAYSIDPLFITALIEKESVYNADIISASNDYGYMQINGINEGWLSEDLGIDNLLDPKDNIYAGTYILSMLFEKYEDASLVLMAYNMGEAGAKRLWEQGIYESGYSRDVLEILRRLEG